MSSVAPSGRICSPAAVEPVKEIARTTGGTVIAAPTSPARPLKKLSTPFGIPAAAKASVNLSPESGASEDGLNTTVFPAIRAGAILRAGIETGKFHGVMTDTTPSGSRSV